MNQHCLLTEHHIFKQIKLLLNDTVLQNILSVTQHAYLKDQLTVDGLTVVDDNLSVTGVARAGESAQGTFTVGTAAFAHKDNLNTNDYANNAERWYSKRYTS